MKIATFNLNGISARLPALLRWLAESKPDVACLQELKAPQEKFPEDAIRQAGYGVIWRGQKSWNGVAILARGADPVESRRGLPGDPEDKHSRYIEALINGVRVGCLYRPIARQHLDAFELYSLSRICDRLSFRPLGRVKQSTRRRARTTGRGRGIRLTPEANARPRSIRENR
jgi:exodeoxyribonuclease III